MVATNSKTDVAGVPAAAGRRERSACAPVNRAAMLAMSGAGFRVERRVAA